MTELPSHPQQPDPTNDPRYPEGPDGPSIHELAGGEEAFLELVDRFYQRVEQDDVLRPVYPEDLEPGKRRLGLFLSQYWGGPATYSEERGHPRLRKRHMPFEVTAEGAARWAAHMAAAVRSMDFDPRVERALLAYVARFAPAMINKR